MKYNQNFRKKKSLVFLRNLKLPYFFSTGKSKRKTAPLLPQNGMLLFVRVFKKYFPMLATWIPGTPNYKKTKNNHKALI